MKHYCTYFDRNYLVRGGLNLYLSLIEHAGALVTPWSVASYHIRRKDNAAGEWR
jgi:hypothetical protein